MASRLEGEEVVARLAAQHAVARELLRAETLDEAAPRVLAAAAGSLGWDLGAIWEVPADRAQLHLAGTWESTPGQAEDFWRMSRELCFAPGVGLPGSAWASGEPAWSSDLAQDPNFPRLIAAEEAGLRTGVAVPIPVGAPDAVVGVIELFSQEVREPDPELRQLLVGFGDQLSQFIRRRRAERAAHQSAALNSAIVSSALDCVITMDHQGLITEFNPAAERTFGRRREDVLGQELAELIIPPDLRPRHREGLRKFRETGAAQVLDRRLELQGLRADGSQFPVELAITRIPGVEPPLFTGYLRDISHQREAARAQRHLATIVETSDDAILSKDLNGVVTSWNPGAERVYGYSAEQAIGRHISFLIPTDHHREEERILERVRGGERIESYETERIRSDGVRIDVSLTVSPVVDPADRIVGASVIARDITARRRRSQAEQFLAAASAEIDRSLDPTQTARTIAATAVPDLAELCVIDRVAEDGSIGESVAAASEPGLAEQLEDLRRQFPLDPAGRHPVAQVLRSGRSVVLRDLTTPEVVSDVAQSDEHRQFMIRAGYNSAAVVPMLARGRLLGALSLLHVDNDRRYDPADLALVEDLGARAAIALDNARLYAERAHVAGTLQRSLLPSVLPQVPGLEIAASYQAAGEGNEVGGDFYDLFDVDRHWWLTIGDVCGKGPEAAALTALMRNSVRALTLVERDPVSILEKVNRVTLRHDLRERFATAVLARLTPADAGLWMTVSCAGHPPPLLLSAGGVVRPVGGRGHLLGVRRDPEYLAEEVELEAGDTMVFYTDGLLDAGAPKRGLTDADLQAILVACAGRSASEVVMELGHRAFEASQGRPRDDLAVVALRVAPGG